MSAHSRRRECALTGLRLRSHKAASAQSQRRNALCNARYRHSHINKVVNPLVEMSEVFIKGLNSLGKLRCFFCRTSIALRLHSIRCSIEVFSTFAAAAINIHVGGMLVIAWDDFLAVECVFCQAYYYLHRCR